MSEADRAPWSRYDEDEPDIAATLAPVYGGVIQMFLERIEADTAAHPISDGEKALCLMWLLETFARTIMIGHSAILADARLGGVSRERMLEVFGMTEDQFEARFPGVEQIAQARMLADVFDEAMNIPLETMWGLMQQPVEPRSDPVG